MTKYTFIHFQLARSGVALVIAGALLVAALLVAAGYIAGAARVLHKTRATAVPAHNARSTGK